MSDKKELIRLAAELKQIADRLLDCAKEDDKEEKGEDYPKPSGKHSVLALMLKKKLGEK